MAHKSRFAESVEESIRAMYTMKPRGGTVWILLHRELAPWQLCRVTRIEPQICVDVYLKAGRKWQKDKTDIRLQVPHDVVAIEQGNSCLVPRKLIAA